ncbi:hypothetical protein GQ651_04990 [Alphaproteobacteria bacterium GH1-50]|uniref:Porin domain-containing protein n=1 Tax=Kangsaoukella pontilimi TaxID=2691042 RepID=A0A7C9MIS5_9RHOB|nr:hypothetical protein [Kangsaoukella pontilimi]MXQ07195.1 hypothetical protein [Kangsaoukella pontilimi]
MKTAILAAVMGLAAAPVFAESSLGIEGATLSFGMTQDEAGDAQTQVRATVDVAVTGAHGLQGDLAFEDTAHGTIGRLTGHLYMDPVAGQKYGLFLAMSDLDGRSLTWGELGAEGQLEISDTLTIEGRTGLGRADSGSLDYIFGGVALAAALTDSFDVELSLDVADFDEAAFRATAVDLGLRANYSREGSPWGVYAELIHSDLTGRDGAPAETRLGLGLTMAFGNAGGVSTDGRAFRDRDPVAALIRRGLR